ncbi:MAG: ATP-binding protein [Prevotella sp.]|uniref:AAA family ATPase n=1 Tax=Prevotella sp. TaxID=59823 RepID=UPI002A26A759|nr:ATP-binding protein [Prevotella sp.]MDD7317913.1 ATP-binding protein [Prevotellaceae bacterium]MDY4020804.1 ATP-binding protein [Prevotella sp.]
MQINPFILGNRIPEKYFCDREEESMMLVRSIMNQENVVLVSPRRVGKTGLMNHCFNMPEVFNNHIVMYVDILHTTTLKEFIQEIGNAVFRNVARRNDRMMKMFAATVRSLQASFGYDPVNNVPTFDIKLGHIAQPEYSLDEIFEYIEKAEKRCVIAIDEFQQIVNYPEKNIEAILRGRIQRLSNVNFIYSGSERRLMTEMFFSDKRPFFQSATMLHLGVIELPKYADFARKHFEEAGKSIEQAAIEYAYQRYDGITLYLQRMMHDAFSMTKEGETFTKENMKWQSKAYVRQQETRLKEMLSHISEQQKELLYAICEDGIAERITSGEFVRRHNLKSASAVQAALKKLLEYDVVTQNGKQFSISDPLLRIWLRERNSDV